MINKYGYVDECSICHRINTIAYICTPHIGICVFKSVCTLCDYEEKEARIDINHRLNKGDN